MMTQTSKFTPIAVDEVTLDDVKAEYDTIERRIDEASGPQDLIEAIERWNELKRRIMSWDTLVILRFRQDVRDAEWRDRSERQDAMSAQSRLQDLSIKRKVIESPWKADVTARFGPQALRLWEADSKTYNASIDELVIREGKLERDYVALTGNLTVAFQGRRFQYADMRGNLNDPDRSVRYESERAKWEALSTQQEDLDRIYHDLVQTRDKIAKRLGFDTFIHVGYARLRRVDYNHTDVARLRDAIETEVVPLATRIVERSAVRRGYERTMVWDETALLPAPASIHIKGPGLISDVPAILQEVHSELAAFGMFMREHNYFDFESREGKSPGAFCATFPTAGHPFIYASFNSSKDDVEFLIHEMGHAFQWSLCKRAVLADYYFPTPEGSEIHAMSLSHLARPALCRYLGIDEAEGTGETVATSILFLCYTAAMDYFQERVYTEPNATPDGRRRFWLEAQARYMPWRDYGDISYPAAGNVWQQQPHIYNYALQYMCYGLAQTCALQFRFMAREDEKKAMERYLALCRLGGALPFLELVSSAGLKSPFDPDTFAFIAEGAAPDLKAAQLI